MQARPNQWTHHHTHRLFHVSLGLCFAFIALTIMMGLLVVWFGASAADPISHSVNISAIVGGVNPGPITPGGSSGSVPTPKPVIPTITITAEPEGQVPQEPLHVGQQTVPAYVFPVANPAFSGQTSVPGGLIFLTIEGPQSFNSSAVADSSGNWLWQSPWQLKQGNYSITATVYNPNDPSKLGSARAYFIIKPSATSVNEPTFPTGPAIPPPNNGSSGGPSRPSPDTNQSFGIFLEVLPDYKEVAVGNKIIAAITLVNKFSKDEVPNQVIEYQVQAWDGSIIMESIDTVSFSQMSRFLKTILTAPGTKPGLYRLIVKSTLNDITYTASDTFVLKPAALSEESTAREKPVILWSAFAGLLTLFLLLVYIAYYQTRMVSRHIKEHNDRYHKES